MSKEWSDKNFCEVRFVFETITESERDRIMGEIHDIALEIALGCEEEDGVRSLCTA